MFENRTEIMGKVVSLAQIIDYQEGSVVSREVIRKDAGTTDGICI